MRHHSPLVTVYITNYNYGSYIREAIESVLNQTLQDFELLIIDDGSTDNSREIIEQYADDERISIIYQKNSGLNITNNVALKASLGKYIVRLDADDFLDRNALKAMSDKLEEDPDLGLIFPNYFIVDSQGATISEVKRHDFSQEVKLLDQPAHGACTMIRSRFLKEVGGYDESYTCQDGYELWVKFISKFKVTNINKTLFSYRRHSNNLTNNESKILGTRSRIKQAFVKRNNLKLPRTVAVLPIRPHYDIPLEPFGTGTFLDYKIEMHLKAENVQKLIITSSDPEIRDYVENRYSEKNVIFNERPSAVERINVSLFKTLEFLFEKGHLNEFQACLFSSVEYPFIGPEVMNDAVNTLAIFKADSLITVRPESNKFYRHTGEGMKAILHQDMFTKLEREALYKYTGGVILVRIKSALEAGRLVHGNVGHIVIGEEETLNVESAFERRICHSLLAGEHVEKST
jgi:glycosyltransferase involved in cell wall biosynthesis